MLNVLDPAPPATSQARRFDELFRHFYPRLIPFAERLLGDRAEAEDVLQEAFLRLARSWQRPLPGRQRCLEPDLEIDNGDDSLLDRPDEVVGAWLRRVVLNLGTNRLRGRRRAAERAERAGRLDSTVGPGSERTDLTTPAAEAIRAETRAEVRAALLSLPERQRNCLLLRHAGHSYAEIATTLGIAIGSVGVYLARAERAFRAAYQPHSSGSELDPRTETPS